MNTLFQNIRLIDPVSSTDKVLNLHIVDGEIAYCDTPSTDIDTTITEVIDGTNLVASPGFIDIHTHLRDPGYTHKETIETGLRAAANGGFTEVVCMPNTNPAIDNGVVVEYLKSKSKEFATKLHISGTITKGREGKIISNMHSLANAGVVMFSDDGGCVSNTEVMKNAIEYAVTNDYLLAQHCEEEDLTNNFGMNEGHLSMKLGLRGYPKVAEELIIERDVRLCDYYRNKDGATCRIHFQHLSSAGSLEIIRRWNKKVRISSEVTPHHIWFTEEKLMNYDGNYKMNPPLRTQEDIDALILGLKDGTIDCIASDHAPHSAEECEVEFENIPNGIIGLETSIGAVLTLLYHKHGFSLSDIIRLMSTNPRKLLGLAQVEFAVGCPANITIFNPTKKWIVDANKFQTLCRNTPFNGIEFVGCPVYIINNRQVVKTVL